MSALGGLALLAYGLGLGLLAGAVVGWLLRDRDDRVITEHNDRLRLKNRQLHDKCRRLEAERAELNEFLSVVTASDWEAS